MSNFQNHSNQYVLYNRHHNMNATNFFFVVSLWIDFATLQIVLQVISIRRATTMLIFISRKKHTIIWILIPHFGYKNIAFYWCSHQSIRYWYRIQMLWFLLLSQDIGSGDNDAICFKVYVTQVNHKLEYLQNFECTYDTERIRSKRWNSNRRKHYEIFWIEHSQTSQ